jgi:hypothetical protein
VTVEAADDDCAAILGELYGDGIIALKGAFTRDFADRLNADVMALFGEAMALPGGAVARGPNRYYVEVQPERIRGFVEIASHPWFVAVCDAALGADYRIVEVGFDIPLPGAADQPWHRDFPADEANATGRRISSLAFNLTTVDTRPEHGPFEIAPGTQWDDIGAAKAGMFPASDLWPRYVARAEQKLPRRGDITARTGLTIHRGTANRSSEPRPVVIVGVVAADCTSAERHQLQVTQAYLDGLPARVRDHLFATVVEQCGPIAQGHMIEGLLEPDYG